LVVNAENVIKNWTESSGNYSKLIERELASFKRQAWTELILANAGKSGKLKILDVGTGPGFFTIIMSMAGNDVTAIDCTQAMLDEAQNNAKRNGVSPRFLLSDTQETPFDDESFDLIISRNVAWTILDAEKAYAEWRRILRPDGRVLIFDANWNRRLFDENKNSEYLRDVEAVKRLYPDFQVNIHSSDMDEFRRTMPMCARIRPQWDLEALLRVGYSKVSCDTSIGKLIYDEPEQLLYKSSPMFLLIAEK
jgi:ubiquinone/menaquinone biosynthesis C-methylase UbiE